MCSRWALLPLVTLPQARRLVAAMASESGAALNPRLGETARLLLFFGLLFALGLSR
jgi:1,4-dihydroxy-2-naphthoate octaprenyltransferase